MKRPGWVLLAGAQRDVALLPAEACRWAWVELLIVSGLWSAASAGIWLAAWGRIGYTPGVPLMPAALVLAAGLIGPLRQAAPALGGLLSFRDRRVATATTAATVAVLALALLDNEQSNSYWRGSLPAGMSWLWPHPAILTLLLAPLWGAWAMLILPQFCRPSDRTEPAVAAMSAGCGPLAAAAVMGAVAAATTLYFNFLPWTQLSISAAAILSALVLGAILCRLGGGLCRQVLLANNLLTQIVFLIACQANNR